jgi:O-antigen ligase
MLKLRHILLAILTYSVSTVWVKDRWALSVLEAAVFLCAAWVSLGVARRQQPAATGILPLLLALMCVWGVLQLAARWSVVAADTAGAVLYWLAAACLVWLGEQVCAFRQERRPFLKALLTVGSIVSVFGTMQLFTSGGRVFWLFPSGYDSLVIGPFVYRNNYAAFVELLLPIALVLGFHERRHRKAWLIVAGALVASVIAAGSRAGSVIVIAEAALAFLLRRRADRGAVGRHWVTFVVAASAFSLIVGYQFLWDRFNQKDPYAVRREFVESSLAMVRAQPLHGYGFGTWPSAYKPFAIIDIGAIANHAHNEWAQWAAEGGLPALVLMLAVFVFCLPSALRSVWGLGVVAVFVHSWLDYPFVRLGLGAWIFVLIGALAGYGRERRRLQSGQPPVSCLPSLPARIIAAMALPVLTFGVYQSLKVGWADTLYHRATPDGVARAASLWPDQAEFHLGLAQTDPDRAGEHLRRAVALNPFLTTARIALASRMEAAGDMAGAEGALLEAARRDKQYAPAWALANFYFRANQPGQFWRWARTATRISYGGLHPLFDLCFALTDNAQVVLDRVVVSRRLIEREYLAYLIDQGRIKDAGAAACRIASSAGEDDRGVLLDYVDRALDAGEFQAALEIWDHLAARRLVPYEASQPGVLVNGDFRQPILNHAFDWRTPATGCAVAAQTLNAGPALEVSFSGKQPENCEFLNHFVALARGAPYVLRFQYRTRDLPERTGLGWSLGLAPDHQLPAAEEWSTGEWHFQAPAGAVRLVLAYRRALGTRRIEGTLLLRQVRLEVDHGPR